LMLDVDWFNSPQKHRRGGFHFIFQIIRSSLFVFRLKANNE
jgi:hypothetical protein